MHNRLPAYLPTSLIPRGVVRFGSRRVHLAHSETYRGTQFYCGRWGVRIGVRDYARRVGCTDCVRAARELGYDV